jgi:chemotaxis protein MotB
MSDKCNCPEEGLPEWIMSYADMITILMAFFVVMYSMAGDKNPSKQEAVMQSLHDRFGPEWLKHLTGVGPGPYVPKDSPIAGIKSGNKNRDKEGTKDKQKGKRETRSRGDHPRVHTLRPGEQAAVGGIIYFPDGGSELAGESLEQLQIAAEEISGKPQRVEVRGHTSRRRPSKDSGYQDNWDLAYARAKSVMNQLVAMGIDSKRIVIGVSAENEPVGRGADPLALSRSARVEVFMLNETVEPTAQSVIAPDDQSRAKD